MLVIGYFRQADKSVGAVFVGSGVCTYQITEEIHWTILRLNLHTLAWVDLKLHTPCDSSTESLR